MKKKMVLFTNCHGERYIEMFKRDSKIDELFEIEYIVSYTQLNNFAYWKNSFKSADVLIINNIKNYNDYTLANLKKILKKDVILIVIPFVRFEGYWLEENYKNLKFFSNNSVSFFPNLKLNAINSYLNFKIDKKFVIKHFFKCLKKLKVIEEESDIEFFDFFIKNHKKYPMFRDNYHPTVNMLEYLGSQIMKKINKHVNIEYNEKKLILVKDVKEWGHYKPILNNIKKILGIEYELDEVFVCSRETYLRKIINYEINGKRQIKDLEDMKKNLFSEFFS